MVPPFSFGIRQINLSQSRERSHSDLQVIRQQRVKFSTGEAIASSVEF